MRVERLELEDFRNYPRGSLELAAGLNLVVGRNAQGKTNLLEAVHCLSGLGSPRTTDAALVREGAERSLLHADVTRGERTVRVDLEIAAGGRTRALINQDPGAIGQVSRGGVRERLLRSRRAIARQGLPRRPAPLPR